MTPRAWCAVGLVAVAWCYRAAAGGGPMTDPDLVERHAEAFAALVAREVERLALLASPELREDLAEHLRYGAAQLDPPAPMVRVNPSRAALDALRPPAARPSLRVVEGGGADD